MQVVDQGNPVGLSSDQEEMRRAGMDVEVIDVLKGIQLNNEHGHFPVEPTIGADD